MTTNPEPLSKTTSLDEALREFRVMSDLNASLERQIKEFSDLNAKLMADNEATRHRIEAQEKFFTTQIETLTGQRDRLQRKCVALMTRLTGIKEAILSAERESHEEAIKNPAAEQIGNVRLSEADEKALHEMGLNKPDHRLPGASYHQ